MKNTIRFLGIIALAVVIGFAMAGCKGPADPVNQTPVAGDYDIGNLTQTEGSITAVTVTAKAGKSPGTVTVLYDGSATIPQTAGSFAVTFNVAAATGWNAASGLSAGTLTVNTNPSTNPSTNPNTSTTADPAVTWPAGLTALYGQTLSDISLASYTNDPAGTFSWTTPGASVGALGAQSHSMTFTPTDTDTYNTAADNVSVIVRLVEMVSVAGGSFRMGQNGDGSAGNVEPVHTVTLSGFNMGKYEVTQKQWQTVMGTTLMEQNDLSDYPGIYGEGDNYPMYQVSWYDALVFCNKLSIAEGLTPAYRIDGKTDPDEWGTVPTGMNDATWDAVTIVNGSTGYRLPTEAQWEYAAKGGNNSPGNYIYAGSDTVDDVAWYSGNNGASDEADYGSKAVGTKASNGLGLYDMSGNVFEWCWDWYDTYQDEAQTNPVGASSGSYRVVRGGSWGNSATSVRSAYRYYDYPGSRDDYVGFRLVRP